MRDVVACLKGSCRASGNRIDPIDEKRHVPGKRDVWKE